MHARARWSVLLAAFVCLLPVSAPRAQDAAAGSPGPIPPAYRTHDQLTGTLRSLAARFPRYCRLQSIGSSIQQKELWLLTVTDFEAGDPGDNPALMVTGGMHGNEVSTTPVVVHALARILERAAEPAIAERLARTTLYAVPALNPDSMDRYLQGHGTRWRPRGNQRPIDDDGDGAFDEDGYEDINGDGAISLMRRRDADGRWQLVGTEGIDNDGDGKLNEDIANGVDLNRNFPAGHRPGRFMGSSRGDVPLSEPESRALAMFVREHPEIAFALDYHNEARCLFFRVGDAGTLRGGGAELSPARTADLVALRPLLEHGERSLGYEPRPCGEAGIYISWCYEHLGIPGAIVELDSVLSARIVGRVDEDALRRQAEQDLGSDHWVEWSDFDHPTLGAIQIGGDFRPFVRRNPPPTLLGDLCDRQLPFLLAVLDRLPRLSIDIGEPRVTDAAGHRIADELRLNDDGSPTYVELPVVVRNDGDLPTNMARLQELLGSADSPERACLPEAGVSLDVAIDGGWRQVPITGERVGATALNPGARPGFALQPHSSRVVLLRFHVDSPGSATIRARLSSPRGGSSVAERLVDVRRGDEAPARTPAGYPRAPDAANWNAGDGVRTTATATGATCGPFVNGRAIRPTPDPGVVTTRPRAFRLAVVLIEFADHPHDARFTPDDFDRMLFSVGGYHIDPQGRPAAGSMRDFYREMSSGLLDITGTVFDWVTVPVSHEQQIARPMVNNPQLREPALHELYKRHGRAIADDYDGYLFLAAGNGGPRGRGLWPHRGKVGDKPYIQLSELHPRTDDRIIGVGVPCHEFGHIFGFKDMYGLRNTRMGPGAFSLMGNGTHGWPPGDANFPHHMDAWCKSQIGWLDPVVIDPRVPQRLALRPVTTDRRECFKVLLREDGSEYYLLENRPGGRFERHFPAPGLLIWHVGERRIADGFPVAEMDVCLEAAHGIDVPDAGNRYAPWAAWPLPHRKAFTPESVPSSRSLAAGALEVRLTNIERDAAGNVFVTVGGDATNPPAATGSGETRTVHLGVILARTPSQAFEDDLSSRTVRREAERLWVAEGARFRTTLDGQPALGGVADFVAAATARRMRFTGTVIRPATPDGGLADTDPWVVVPDPPADPAPEDVVRTVLAALPPVALEGYQTRKMDARATFDLLVVCTTALVDGGIRLVRLDDRDVLLVPACRTNLRDVPELVKPVMRWLTARCGVSPSSPLTRLVDRCHEGGTLRLPPAPLRAALPGAHVIRAEVTSERATRYLTAAEMHGDVLRLHAGNATILVDCSTPWAACTPCATECRVWVPNENGGWTCAATLDPAAGSAVTLAVGGASIQLAATACRGGCDVSFGRN